MLPESIGLMTALKTLYLDENQITTLPESIVALTALKTLHLWRNPFNWGTAKQIVLELRGAQYCKQ